MHLNDILRIVTGIGKVYTASEKSVKGIASTLEMMSNFSIKAATRYAAVFQQVNTGLSLRNDLIRIGTQYLHLASEQMGDALAQTAQYGMDLRGSHKSWAGIAATISEVNYITGATTTTLAKLANVTSLLGGNFDEISAAVLGIVKSTALTGEEAADMAVSLSDMNLLYGSGNRLSMTQLGTVTKMADRLKQAGGNASEITKAITEANKGFTGAVAMGFLPGFANTQKGLDMYQSRLLGMGKLVMAQAPLVRGIFADAFGPMFNLSGEALMRHAVDATKALSPIELAVKDVKEAWNEAVASMGDGFTVMMRIGKNFLKGVILPFIIEPFNRFTKDLLDNKDKFAEWSGSVQKAIEKPAAALKAWLAEWTTGLPGKLESISEWFKDLPAKAHEWQVGFDKLYNSISDISKIGKDTGKVWDEFTKSISFGNLTYGKAAIIITSVAGALWLINTALGALAVTLNMGLPGFLGVGAAILAIGKAVEWAGPSIAGMITAMSGGFVAAVSVLSSSIERLAKVDATKLQQMKDGLWDVAVGLGYFAVGSGVSGIVSGIDTLCSGGGVVDRLTKLSMLGGGIQSAASGLLSLSTSISKMPTKLDFDFSDASFRSMSRLRDAVNIVDGGTPQLEKIVGLYERLDTSLRSITNIGTVQLPTKSSAVAMSPIRTSVSAAAEVSTSTAQTLATALEKQTARQVEAANAERAATQTRDSVDRENALGTKQREAARTPRYPLK